MAKNTSPPASLLPFGEAEKLQRSIDAIPAGEFSDLYLAIKEARPTPAQTARLQNIAMPVLRLDVHYTDLTPERFVAGLMTGGSDLPGVTPCERAVTETVNDRMRFRARAEGLRFPLNAEAIVRSVELQNAFKEKYRLRQQPQLSCAEGIQLYTGVFDIPEEERVAAYGGLQRGETAGAGADTLFLFSQQVVSVKGGDYGAISRDRVMAVMHDITIEDIPGLMPLEKLAGETTRRIFGEAAVNDSRIVTPSPSQAAVRAQNLAALGSRLTLKPRPPASKTTPKP